MTLYRDWCEKQRVSSGRLPDWKLQAAEEGRVFAAKCFRPDDRHWRPTLKWFSGSVSTEICGLVHWLDREVVWLSADLKTFEDVLEVSAHEHAHAAGCPEEDVPNLVGRMAVKHRTEGRVIVHHGDLVFNRMPPGETELLGDKVFALEIIGPDDATAYMNRGTATRPMWRRINATV